MTPTEQDNELRAGLIGISKGVDIPPRTVANENVMLYIELEPLLDFITAYTNAEIAKVLDRLEGHSGKIDLCSYEDIQKAIPLDVIQAERAKLKEVK